MKLILLLITLTITQLSLAKPPLKLAIAGLSHGHVDWIFNRDSKNDVELIGIYETNPALIKQYIARYQLSEDLFYTDLSEMLDKLKPEAVSAFGAINEHIEIVRACAPRKIHVMVEKPLATTYEDAKEIQQLADQNKIHVLTNFETSWYESNQQIKRLLDQDSLGVIRKVLVNDGHQGPKEIGVSKEFLDILTDKVKNGAGALVDFGCYGANLSSWLMDGMKPISVTAVIHQNKPDIYQDVDDESTIILQYPHAQCIIQGSWNWTFARKDMEVYGTKGYAKAADAKTLRTRFLENQPEQVINLKQRPYPYDDPFSFFAAVISESIALEDLDMYGLKINSLAVEILEAAMKSAQQKKTIYL